MVRVKKSLDEIVEARREGAKRAFERGEPKNLTPEQKVKRFYRKFYHQ